MPKGIWGSIENNKAWKAYRHATAFRNLLISVGIWPYVAGAGSVVLGAAVGLLASLPLWGKILVGLATSALLLFIAGLTLVVWKVYKQPAEEMVKIEPQTETTVDVPERSNTGPWNWRLVISLGALILLAAGIVALIGRKTVPNQEPIKTAQGLPPEGVARENDKDKVRPSEQQKQVAPLEVSQVQPTQTKHAKPLGPSSAKPAEPSKREGSPADAASKGTPAQLTNPPSQGSGTTTGPVTIQPGGVASINQQGGVTAGQYINQAPAPVVEIKEIEVNRSDGNSYITRLRISITRAIVPTFAIRISGPSMTSMEVGEHQGNLFQSVSELKDGTKTHTFSNVMGDYEMILKSDRVEHFTIAYGCSPIRCD